MQEAIHREEVMRQFEKMLERDHAKTKITQVSELGLVEMTRKRTRESLEHLLCESCPTCQGRGFVKTQRQYVTKYFVRYYVIPVLRVYKWLYCCCASIGD